MADTRSLGALDGEHPCGPDLEYDPVFLDLETLARGKSEQQFGETVVAAEAPDWKAVLDCCDRLNERTRDLRVLVYQSRALTALRGVRGAAEGYEMIRGVISELWNEVHPKLDADDDNDPTMRLNALAALTDNFTGLKELRAADWITAKGVHCSVRQALAALVGSEASSVEPLLSSTELNAMVAETAKSDAANYARDAIAAIVALSTLLNERVGTQRATDFRPLISLLKPLAECFDQVIGQGDSSQAERSQDDSIGLTATGRVRPASGAIRDRGEASQILDRVCKYLELNEPSNPAPLLIRRAQRLLSMNFIDIVKDMAPDALANVENIAGTNRNNPAE